MQLSQHIHPHRVTPESPGLCTPESPDLCSAAETPRQSPRTEIRSCATGSDSADSTTQFCERQQSHPPTVNSELVRQVQTALLAMLDRQGAHGLPRLPSPMQKAEFLVHDVPRPLHCRSKKCGLPPPPSTAYAIIPERLIVGSHPTLADLQQLSRMGVTTCICLDSASELTDKTPYHSLFPDQSVKLLHCALDAPWSMSKQLETMRTAVATIVRVLQTSDGPVFVHSEQASRAVILLCVFLSQAYGMEADQAIAYIQNRAPVSRRLLELTEAQRSMLQLVCSEPPSLDLETLPDLVEWPNSAEHKHGHGHSRPCKKSWKFWRFGVTRQKSAPSR